jgi:hypothetical protein
LMICFQEIASQILSTCLNSKTTNQCRFRFLISNWSLSIILFTF